MRRADSTTQVSLFPFMAVLLCTMGALILLLVLIAKSVRENHLLASTTVDTESLAELHRLVEQTEDTAWMTDGLEKSLLESQDLQEELKEKLAFLDDHIQKLTDQYLQTLATVRQFAAIQETSDSVVAELKKTLEEKQAILAQKSEILRQKQSTGTPKKQGFAIVPFRGRNMTDRYPVYVECKKDSIVLQPEGIDLYPMDFAAANLNRTVDVNSLTAAVKAATKYLAENGKIPPNSHAYPLLIVRPSGIESYVLAAAVLTRTEHDFGYELVEEDWEITYPPVDDTLRSRMMANINQSRREISGILQATAVERRSEYIGEKYTLDTDGRPKLVSSGTRPIGSTTSKTMPSPWEVAVMEQSAESSRRTAAQLEQSVQNTQNTSRKFTIQAVPPSTFPHTTTGLDGTLEMSAAQQHDTQRWYDETATDSQLPLQHLQEGAATERIANSQGQNWGLRGAKPTAIGITKYVRVQCEVNRLVLPNQMGLHGGEKVVPISGSLCEAAMELAKHIGEYTESWGPAGTDKFWRPVLKIRVNPDAEPVFRELQTLLDGSGFTIERM